MPLLRWWGVRHIRYIMLLEGLRRAVPTPAELAYLTAVRRGEA